MQRKLLWSAAALAVILLTGTVGYWLIGGRQDSPLDTLYMTAITITTVGYGEIIDLSDHPGGRVFTIFLALSGIGVLFYVVTNLTASAVEGELTRPFWKRRMEKMAGNSEDHYVVCGIGRVGFHIADELHATRRPFVMVDSNEKSISRAMEEFSDAVFVAGDATDNDTLQRAAIEKAKGLFAVTGDDNHNLVITLTAKDLSPRAKVVARCNATDNAEKMRRVGADAVISPNSIGGLRMASEMIRPTAVSFLDTMIRDRESGLRLEEVSVPESYVGKAVSALDLKS